MLLLLDEVTDGLADGMKGRKALVCLCGALDAFEGKFAAFIQGGATHARLVSHLRSIDIIHPLDLIALVDAEVLEAFEVGLQGIRGFAAVAVSCNPADSRQTFVEK